MTAKKLISLCLCVCICALSGPSREAFAYSMPATIRIGLTSRYNNVSSISVSSQSLLVGYGSAGVFRSDGMVTGSGAFSVVPADRYYVSQGVNYGSYDQARQAANALETGGQACAVAFVDNGDWQVYLGGYGDEAGASAAAVAGGSLLSPNGRRTALTDGEREAIIFENRSGFAQVADANGGTLSLGERKYRGAIEFARTAGGQLTAVNALSSDEYLYSVVPSEMPGSWPVEALKAQAVAARCYTVTRMGVHSSMGYDLCDEVHCQNYLGADGEYGPSTAAVAATSGVMAYYAGRPINATYFSSSGGATEDGDNVWSDPTPYLKSVPEVAETEYKSWLRTFTLADITALLSANGAGIGEAVSLSVSSDSSSGRVTSMTITGTGGEKTYTKNSVRTFFSPSSGGALESTNFAIANGSAINAASAASAVSVVSAAIPADAGGLLLDNATMAALTTESTDIKPAVKTSFRGADGGEAAVTSQTVAGDHIVFSGKGWGHGAGMSQFGAKGMAEAGYTYDQILKHYYTGIELR